MSSCQRRIYAAILTAESALLHRVINRNYNAVALLKVSLLHLPLAVMTIGILAPPTFLLGVPNATARAKDRGPVYQLHAMLDTLVVQVGRCRVLCVCLSVSELNDL